MALDQRAFSPPKKKKNSLKCVEFKGFTFWFLPSSSALQLPIKLYKEKQLYNSLTFLQRINVA